MLRKTGCVRSRQVWRSGNYAVERCPVGRLKAQTSAAYTVLPCLLQLFSAADPMATLLQVPEQISARLPQPAGQMPTQPAQVSLLPPAEPAKAAQVKGAVLSWSVTLWVDEKTVV